MTEMLTNKPSILAALKRRIKRVPVEDVGCFMIRSLSGASRARLADLFKALDEKTQEENQRDIQSRIVALALVDEAGERIFTDSDDDLTAIAGFDAKVLDELTQAILSASGLKTDGVQAAAKNLDPIPSELPHSV